MNIFKSANVRNSMNEWISDKSCWWSDKQLELPYEDRMSIVVNSFKGFTFISIARFYKLDKTEIAFVLHPIMKLKPYSNGIDIQKEAATAKNLDPIMIDAICRSILSFKKTGWATIKGEEYLPDQVKEALLFV